MAKAIAVAAAVAAIPILLVIVAINDAVKPTSRDEAVIVAEDAAFAEVVTIPNRARAMSK